MKNLVLCGVDVSAASFSAAIRVPEEPDQVAGFPNTAAGHRKFCRRLTRSHRCVRVCLEATGVYGLDLALALHRSSRIEVMVANPRNTRDFARACMQRSKTDRTDARSILEFLTRMPFTPWNPPSTETLNLQAITRRISALILHRTQEKNRYHAARRRQQTSPALLQDIEAHIDYLEQSINGLLEEATEIVRADVELRRRYRHLISIKGISTMTAVRILAELALLPEDMAAKQWVAHAGLDPRHHESGTSVNKPARISRNGNRHLRAALYMPALVAIRHEPNIQAFYQKLVIAGKKPMQAITAVMRKLLHAIHGMFRYDRPFEGDKFYAMNA